MTKSITGTHVNLLTMAMISLSMYLIRAGSDPAIISQKTQYGGLFNLYTSGLLRFIKLLLLARILVFRSFRTGIRIFQLYRGRKLTTNFPLGLF